MRATPETRRTVVFTATVLFAPLILWGAFGLLDQLSTRFAAWPVESTSQWQYQQEQKVRLVADRLKWEGSQNKWEEIPTLIQREFGTDCPPRLLPYRAEAHWNLGHPRQAAADWEQFYAVDSPLARLETLALQGDRKGYAAAGKRLLAQPAHSGLEANNQAWALVLLPDALPSYAPVVALARQGVAEARTDTDRSIYLNTLGVALYRAGQLPAALEQLRLSERLRSQPVNWPFFSLLYRKLAQPKKARQWDLALERYLKQSFGDPNAPHHELLLFQKELHRDSVYSSP